MVKPKELIETTDELMEQIVLTFNPSAEVYKTVGDKLEVKKKYGEMRTRIFTIMNNNFNGGRAYKIKE